MKLPHIFRKIFGLKNPAPPGMRIDHSRFDRFACLWNDSSKRTPLRISRKLSFSKYFTFDSGMNYVLNLTGKPAFVMENRPFDLDILVYMQEVKGSDVRFELHFMKGKLFFISYTYFNISDIERENVIRSLCEKFGAGIPADEVGNYILTDNDGNGLMFDMNEHFSVNYLAPNSKSGILSRLEAMSSRRAV